MQDEIEWPKLVPELTVLNFNESLNFYTNIMGFQIENIRKQPDFAYLKLGDAHIMIEECHPEVWKTGELAYPLGVGLNFQIEFPSAEELLNRLSQHEYPLFRGLKESWYVTGDEQSGFKEFLVQDPSGYLLRFSEYLGEKSLPTQS